VLGDRAIHIRSVIPTAEPGERGQARFGSARGRSGTVGGRYRFRDGPDVLPGKT
jgi:hypothetical protein